VFNINTLIATFQFAKELKRTSYGEDLYNKFYLLKETLSIKTWSIYRDVIKTCKFDHYFSFDIAYKKIEQSQLDESTHSNNVIIELNASKELHSLIKLSNKYGEKLEQSYFELLSNLPIKDNNNFFHSFKLYRRWLDVFYSLHSTKLFYYLHSKIGKENFENKLIQQYLDQREIYPFSSQNRKLVRELRSELNERDLWFLEFFESTRRSILQLIFETHFDFSLEIRKEEIIQIQTKTSEDIRLCKIKIKGLYGLSQGDFLILYEDDEVQDIGIIQRKTVYGFEKREETLSTIIVLLYPKDDKEMFFFDL